MSNADHRMQRRVTELERRVERLEGLLRSGAQIGETEHGDRVFVIIKGRGVLSPMASVLLKKEP